MSYSFRPLIISLLTVASSLLIPFNGFAQNAMSVMVSIVPQQYVLEKIAGETVDVSVMVNPGASPATYEPKPAQLAALSKASMYFSIGVPFEAAWLERITSANKHLTMVAMDSHISKIAMAAHSHGPEETGNAKHDEHGEHDGHDHDTHHHSHADVHHADKEMHAGHAEHHHDADHKEQEHHRGGHADHHHEDGLDPHVWLSPIHMKTMARTTAEALSKAAPQHADLYAANLAAFERELTLLETTLHGIFGDTPAEKRAFMIFHPSWGYFAQAYGLQQIPIELEGKEPSPRTMQQLVEAAKEHNISVVFVAPQFSQKSATAIARNIGGTVVTADPLAKDWADNLVKVAHAFTASFRK
ncbi:metal ABC transporter solute-binding protein, Zn/Mn family [Oleidesulfovibrio sp.]|uniref:metal ABC transporter solute-binding protein, Zn/Mn family n=1 Tax=Oleidesulfovibrio sp. TaxID=2909707 RepID=UPI003A89FA83